MSHWFYIQRWAEKRWSYVGKELPVEEALRLYAALNDNTLVVAEKVSDPSVGKVVALKEPLTKDWVLRRA